MRTAYLCDGLDRCRDKFGCYRQGGECRHTTNRKHALCGACDDPENHPERFRTIDHKGSEFDYWEEG